MASRSTPAVGAAKLARLQAYKALRDGGSLSVDAAREVGIGETSRHGYERWYREDSGLPRRPQGRWLAYGEPRIGPERGGDP